MEVKSQGLVVREVLLSAGLKQGLSVPGVECALLVSWV